MCPSSLTITQQKANNFKLWLGASILNWSCKNIFNLLGVSICHSICKECRVLALLTQQVNQIFKLLLWSSIRHIVCQSIKKKSKECLVK